MLAAVSRAQDGFSYYIQRCREVVEKIWEAVKKIFSSTVGNFCFFRALEFFSQNIALRSESLFLRIKDAWNTSTFRREKETLKKEIQSLREKCTDLEREKTDLTKTLSRYLEITSKDRDKSLHELFERLQGKEGELIRKGKLLENANRQIELLRQKYEVSIPSISPIDLGSSLPETPQQLLSLFTHQLEEAIGRLNPSQEGVKSLRRICRGFEELLQFYQPEGV